MATKARLSPGGCHNKERDLDLSDIVCNSLYLALTEKKDGYSDSVCIYTGVILPKINGSHLCIVIEDKDYSDDPTHYEQIRKYLDNFYAPHDIVVDKLILDMSHSHVNMFPFEKIVAKMYNVNLAGNNLVAVNLMNLYLKAVEIKRFNLEKNKITEMAQIKWIDGHIRNNMIEHDLNQRVKKNGCKFGDPDDDGMFTLE